MWTVLLAAGAVALSLPVDAAFLKTQYDIEWKQPLEKDHMDAHCGDKLHFTWEGLHGIWLMPSKECPIEDPLNREIEVLHSVSRNGDYTYTIPSDFSGPLYLACPVPSMCESGMLLTVDVTCSAVRSNINAAVDAIPDVGELKEKMPGMDSVRHVASQGKAKVDEAVGTGKAHVQQAVGKGQEKYEEAKGHGQDTFEQAKGHGQEAYEKAKGKGQEAFDKTKETKDKVTQEM